MAVPGRFREISFGRVAYHCRCGTTNLRDRADLLGTVDACTNCERHHDFTRWEGRR